MKQTSSDAVRRAARAVAVGLALALAWAAAAQPPPSDPAGPLLRLHAGLLAQAATGWPPERAAVARLVADSFDLAFIARAVLGARAASASEAQQQRLAAVLGRRMMRELMRRKPAGEDDLKILGVRAIDGEWLVASSVVTPRGEAAVLHWRVRALPQGLRIVDAMRDGASAVITMRQDVAEALRRQTLDEVIDAIERRDTESAP